MKVKNIRNAKWSDQGKTNIQCEIEFDEIGFSGFVPFVASANDVEAHGREIFLALKDGKYGKVAKFSPDKEALTLAAETKIKDESSTITQRLQTIYTLSNLVALSQTEEDEKIALERRLVALRAIPSQPDYPVIIDWSVGLA